MDGFLTNTFRDWIAIIGVSISLTQLLNLVFHRVKGRLRTSPIQQKKQVKIDERNVTHKKGVIDFILEDFGAIPAGFLLGIVLGFVQYFLPWLNYFATSVIIFLVASAYVGLIIFIKGWDNVPDHILIIVFFLLSTSFVLIPIICYLFIETLNINKFIKAFVPGFVFLAMVIAAAYFMETRNHR